MRFGISATSSIFPKNLRTRLRPVNVCAIVASFFLRPPRMGGGVLQRVQNARAGRCSRGGQGIYSALRHAEIVMPIPTATKHRHPGNRELWTLRFVAIGAISDHI